MKALSITSLLLPLLLAGIPVAGQVTENRQADSLLGIWHDASRVDTARFDAMNLLLQRTYHTITPDSIVRVGEQLFYFASKQGLKSRMGIAKAASGNGYYLQGDLVRAKESYAAALALNDQSRSALNGLSAVCMANGDMAQAIEYQSQALTIAESRHDTASMMALLNNIGSNHGFQGDHATALIYMERELALAEKIRDTLSIADALMNIGNAHAQLGDAYKTMDAYERSLHIAERMGNRRQMAQCLAFMAVERNSRKEYEPALELGTRALGLVEEMSDSAQMAMVLVTLGFTHQGLGQPALAAQRGERALRIAQRIGYLDAISQAAGVLYEARKAQGDAAGALAMYELSISSRDSIANDENKQKLLQQKYRYEFEKKEVLLHAEQERKDAVATEELRRKNVQRNAFIGGFGLMLLLAGTFLFQRNRINKEKKRSEELLLNILPAEVAEELKAKGEADAKQIDQVTVLFTDFKGFTAMSEKLTAKELVADIHECFSAFDHIMARHGIEKIKTIGDAYMAAGGLPTPNTTHALDVVKAALEIRDFIAEGKAHKMAAGLPYFEIRIGIHTGPVVAGIVGVKKFAYDIWGDTVNTASRMESSGEVGQVNISESTYSLVKDEVGLTFTPRGKVQAKGKGEMEMYFVGRSLVES